MEASISRMGRLKLYGQGVLRRTRYELARPLNLRDEAHSLATLGSRQLLSKVIPSLSQRLDADLQTRRTAEYQSYSNVSGDALVAIFKSEDVGAIIDIMKSNFTEEFARPLAWLAERLKVSTAGFRGKSNFAEFAKIAGETWSKIENDMHQLAAERGYKPAEENLICLAVWMAAAQGLADWVNENFPPGERRFFVANDPRLFSKEGAEILKRVMLANGIKVYEDTAENTPTPVTSYMGYWLASRESILDAIVRVLDINPLTKLYKLLMGDKHAPFITEVNEESGGCGMGLLNPLHSRILRRILGSAGAAEFTASHNPPGETGLKTADNKGGVATDDITGAQAVATQRYCEKPKAEPKQPIEIRIAPRSALANVVKVDAKLQFWYGFERFIFTNKLMKPLADAIVAQDNPVEHIFDALSGVGGNAAEYTLAKVAEALGLASNVFMQKGERQGGIIILNKKEDPRAAMLPYPDPTLPASADKAGIVGTCAERTAVVSGSLSDMDGDRLTQIYRIPLEKVDTIKRLGVDVSVSGKPGEQVAFARLTPNQLYALAEYSQLILKVQQDRGISFKEAMELINNGQVKMPNALVFTTVASTRVDGKVIRLVGGEAVYTGVGFKNLGDQVAEREDRSTRLCAHDKSAAVAIFLWAVGAQAGEAGLTMMDLYVTMLNAVKSQDYYVRLDRYFPSTANKMALVEKAEGLEPVFDVDSAAKLTTQRAQVVAKLFGRKIDRIDPDVRVKGIVLFDQDETGKWGKIQPRACRIQFTDGNYMEVYHGGGPGKDGPCFTMCDANGNTLFWFLMRRSGTEDLARLYAETSEDPTNPHAENSVVIFNDILHYFGLPEAAIWDRAWKIVSSYATGFYPTAMADTEINQLVADFIPYQGKSHMIPEDRAAEFERRCKSALDKMIRMIREQAVYLLRSRRK